MGMSMAGVRFTEDQSTNLATLYGRALDARAAQPVLGDQAALEAVRQIDYDFGKFKIGKSEAFAIAARGKVFDAAVREFVSRHGDCTVVHLGVGMDSRVFRVDPPASVRWFDVDFPDVIDLRRRVYPARANTTLVGASADELDWIDGVPGDRPVFVVAEGLTMYLTPAAGHALFRRVVEHFAGGEVFVDAYSTMGIKWQKTNAIVRRAKATLRWGIDDANELAEIGLTPVSVRGVEGFLPREDWARLPFVSRKAYELMLLVPALRNMGKLLHYRFGA
jgi:O-methyltransferase involved in polyketide biosynthesis